MSEPAAANASRSTPEKVEDFVLALVLAAMMLLPPLEIALRRAVGAGISNSPSIVQHLTLIAGMLGAAIAARDGRLISLGSINMLIPARWQSVTRAISGVIAAAVTSLLCLASVQFVQTEHGGVARVAYDVPVWVVEVALPVGFAAIALRILRGVSSQWKWRFVAAVTALPSRLSLVARLNFIRGTLSW